MRTNNVRIRITAIVTNMSFLYDQVGKDVIILLTKLTNLTLKEHHFEITWSGKFWNSMFTVQKITDHKC